MSHPFDATLKDILGQDAVDLAPVLGLPTHLPSQTLNVDLSTVSAATDVAFGFGDPVQEITDINFQSGPDPDIDARVHFYNSAYHYRFHVPVRTVLILLRTAADHPDVSGQLAYATGGTEVKFKYEIIRLWQHPIGPFLTGGLALLPLAPLCQLPDDVPLEQSVRDVVHQIDQRLAAEAPYDRAVKLMTATFVLAGLRMEKEALDHIFQGVKVMHESSAFDLYEEKGEIKASQRMLLRMGRNRFGPPDATTEAALRAIKSLDRLERMADAVLTANSWTEFLATP